MTADDEGSIGKACDELREFLEIPDTSRHQIRLVMFEERAAWHRNRFTIEIARAAQRIVQRLSLLDLLSYRKLVAIGAIQQFNRRLCGIQRRGFKDSSSDIAEFLLPILRCVTFNSVSYTHLRAHETPEHL